MEIVNNGICLQEKELSDRCATCRSKLVLCVYKYQSKKLKKVVRCKNCQTATQIE
ncbi:hypothetical protein DSAG12_01782 [Promethearchaeum syntrophicum]|uniref:Uncharacterized protein n=1 Tax=Promethearchaeum syntrophicum TaxID=2594042 RepID=A0A5B9DAG6_9ARCH|nr:hypothetical protein [Candidatus Prometheoarchaeum syntrophicum]QEE15955.1 hypothetical protein DSAG12_01782 [Candidatus Prometheoarchaeum syntrophicum]